MLPKCLSHCFVPKSWFKQIRPDCVDLALIVLVHLAVHHSSTGKEENKGVINNIPAQPPSPPSSPHVGNSNLFPDIWGLLFFHS